MRRQSLPAAFLVRLVAAEFTLDEKGRLQIETLPSSTGPQRLMDVKSWAERYKK